MLSISMRCLRISSSSTAATAETRTSEQGTTLQTMMAWAAKVSQMDAGRQEEDVETGQTRGWSSWSEFLGVKAQAVTVEVSNANEGEDGDDPSEGRQNSSKLAIIILIDVILILWVVHW